MPVSRENDIVEAILNLSLDGRWHFISEYFSLSAAKNTIRKYLKQLVIAGFLTAISYSNPEHYQPRQRYQITDMGRHEAIHLSFRNKHLDLSPRTAERYIQMLTHQIEFYEASIAQLQMMVRTDIIHQDSAVHITRVNERMLALQNQNVDLRQTLRVVQQAFLEADIRAEKCEEELEQVTRQKRLLEDNVRRLPYAPQSIDD